MGRTTRRHRVCRPNPPASRRVRDRVPYSRAPDLRDSRGSHPMIATIGTRTGRCRQPARGRHSEERLGVGSDLTPAWSPVREGLQGSGGPASRASVRADARSPVTSPGAWEGLWARACSPCTGMGSPGTCLALSGRPRRPCCRTPEASPPVAALQAASRRVSPNDVAEPRGPATSRSPCCQCERSDAFSAETSPSRPCSVDMVWNPPGANALRCSRSFHGFLCPLRGFPFRAAGPRTDPLPSETSFRAPGNALQAATRVQVCPAWAVGRLR